MEQQRYLSIQEFNDLLRQWSGKRVKVVKHEMSDLDETLINLDEVSYAKENHDEDDYEPRYALHLNGPGKIGTTENNFEDLPSDKFEIPLEDDALYEYDGSRFLLTTSRGVYSIELLEH
ncbi:hypothetical protein M3210_13825 [Oceanobacillus luteolus]|uniref:Uncharacterized protein n=1 Tax=Oceanobacillus luteolus TaxID=1274358 RepID=A0ABW4HWD2_9BACI|nr:hypothetical protein [Oceanobacillus luteolus]MCM3741347.1 hypothetical protein [Oceanobacillus luteolus]